MSDRLLPPPRPVPTDPLLARLERLERQRQATNYGRQPTTTRQFAPPMAPQPNRPAPGKRAGRKRPARVAKAGALALSCATTAGLVYLFADLNATQAANQALAALPDALPLTTTAASTPAAATTVPVAATPGPTIAPTTAAPVVTAPAVAAYNGDLINTRYGPVQVQLQFTNGAISEVAVVEYPNGDGRSIQINARALPTLRTEVLAAQSAQVDTVSGATYTSNAYTRSLQSAIDQARAAGVTAIA